MVSSNANKPGRRVKLIFNPVSGTNRESPARLMDAIKEIQACKLVPEPYLTEADSDYDRVIRDAVEQGIRLFAVCGGDGTVSAVARALVGTDTTLGIIPSGTQNNIAYSLGIPADVKAAVANLKTGKRLKVDVGMVSCGKRIVPFLEVCSVGLFSALYSSGDDIQHGDISRIGDFLATLTSSPPSEICISLDNKRKIKDLGHVVLVSNMPFVGRRYQVGSENSFRDGYLDVLFYANVPKLDLVVGYMLKLPEAAEDPRIHHFRVRSVTIETHPCMPLIVDGMELPGGPVKIGIQRRALTIVGGQVKSNLNVESGENIEKQRN